MRHVSAKLIKPLGKAVALEPGEKSLWEAHPAMFKNRPFYFCAIIVCAPITFGLSLLFMCGWWLKCRSCALTVTDRRVVHRQGLLSAQTTEVRHKHVRNVGVTQTALQRMLGVGSIEVASAGHGGVEVSVAGIPHPEQVANHIRQHQSGDDE